MKLTKHLSVFIAIVCVLICSCKTENKTRNNSLPTPKIKIGTTKLTGKILDFKAPINGKQATIDLREYTALSTGLADQSSMIDENGNFSFDIPIETSYSKIYLSTESESTPVLIIKAGQEINIEISKDSIPRTLKVNILDPIPHETIIIYDYDLFENLDGSYLKGSDLENKDSILYYSNHPNKFGSFYLGQIYKPELLKLKQDTKLTKQEYEYVFNELTLSYLFDTTPYRLQTGKPDLYYDYKLENRDKSYYSFLKDYDLNNPLYLYSRSYALLLKAILKDKTLNINPIKDMPIDRWSKINKQNLSKLVGFDNGLFFDLLVVFSYIIQVHEESIPVNETQIENIKNYYKGNDIEKIIFTKNKQFLDSPNYQVKLNIRDTPNVENEFLIDCIVDRYEGKVVLINLWATWSKSCLEVIDQFRAKRFDYSNQDIVFVYITNSTSPKDTWLKKIKQIGGEQYYITDLVAWDYILDSFNSNGIPTYAIYNKDGKKIESFIGYPGTMELKAKLDKAINQK